MKPLLGYWNIRGLGQSIRLLLVYRGVDFEEKRYKAGDAPDYNIDCWLKEKYSLGLDFPNLPYYIDGDYRLSQSNAILRYLGRKYDLEGTTEKEKIRVDLACDQLKDFLNGIGSLCYNTKEHFETTLPEFVKNLPAKLKQFEAFLGDRNWILGDKITFVDFLMYELMDQHRVLIPDCLKDFPKLQAFMNRFEALPAIKAYMNSDKFIKRPLYNTMAAFK